MVRPILQFTVMQVMVVTVVWRCDFVAITSLIRLNRHREHTLNLINGSSLKHWLVDWLDGWMVGWLVGWLVGWFVSPSPFVNSIVRHFTPFYTPFHFLSFSGYLSFLSFTLFSVTIGTLNSLFLCMCDTPACYSFSYPFVIVFH